MRYGALPMLLLFVGCVRAGFEAGVEAADAVATRDQGVDLTLDAGHDSPAPDLFDPGPFEFQTPQPITELNTTGHEDDPSLTGDLLSIYFERDKEIMLASRQSNNDPFEVIQNVPALKSSAGETASTISLDGRSIFFSSYRSHPDGQGGADIYLAQRQDPTQPWSDPFPIKELNSPVFDQVFVSEDQLVAVVTSKRDGNLSSTDLFWASRSSPTDLFSTPQLMPLCTPDHHEGDAWLSADRRLLFFSSERPSTTNSRDIWVAIGAGDGAFSQPTPVAGVNSSQLDVDPWLSPDLTFMVFARATSPDGGGDLYIARRQ